MMNKNQFSTDDYLHSTLANVTINNVNENDKIVMVISEKVVRFNETNYASFSF